MKYTITVQYGKGAPVTGSGGFLFILSYLLLATIYCMVCGNLQSLRLVAKSFMGFARLVWTEDLWKVEVE